MIATDLDGTLFGPDHHPAPRSVAAINAAVDAGLHVVAATGRSWFRGLDLATSTGARLHHFIGSNGGHRVRVADRHLEERLVFDVETVEATIAGVSAADENCGFGWELADDMAWDERFIELSPITLAGGRRLPMVERPVDRFDEVGKMFVGHPSLGRVDLVEWVEPLVPDHVNVTTSGVDFVELTPPGADKGAAIARLAAHLGISAHEVLVFGDNQNDLTMFEWAGRSVAMGNALDMVKAVADEVTDTNEDHGVARVIEELLGLS